MLADLVTNGSTYSSFTPPPSLQFGRILCVMAAVALSCTRRHVWKGGMCVLSIRNSMQTSARMMQRLPTCLATLHSNSADKIILCDSNSGSSSFIGLLLISCLLSFFDCQTKMNKPGLGTFFHPLSLWSIKGRAPSCFSSLSHIVKAP